MVASAAPVLVAGASSFVGRGLTRRLAGTGRTVRALVRDARRVAGGFPDSVEIVEADAARSAPAFVRVRVAYYLIQSMGSPGVGPEFMVRDRAAANGFAEAAAAGVERVVYLGGLGDDAPNASVHLASRHEVGEILRSRGASVTELRAGIVVGPGSAGFEMMLQLVEKLPLMICPRWVETRCQSIAADDLVRYLVACLDE